MTSIYKRVLGADFSRLHPMIQQRFGFDSTDGVASVGTGIMERVWYGRAYTLPFLYLGTWRNIMFPERGENVPFTIHNYAYRDHLNRETVTWIREYHFGGRKRRFDATMIYSEQRQKIVDYLGTHQHLAVDIDMSVTGQGGIRLRSGEQRFYEGRVAFRFPMAFSGIADVHEWYDEKLQMFRIQVAVTNTFWGPLFGYEGRFHAAYPEVQAGDIPAYVKPVREERRE
ncbi:hypothetical protein GCM10010912_38070 [Paenibacillus albidus]|uniref:DUF4166 domain-containing protein n=1 Tax=Paenibacillus albidus TaxID=2041023 RepID=A0A917CI17_9BACL|nr:DUF4166 domain-containing protein [Paenibacillus albidus]GGF89323.1 hypothetical protein GCM10010912_38070 [Paenibacillus albidus]